MPTIRELMLFAKGLLYDTKQAYHKASKDFNKHDLEVDVNGLVFLITGANSGIGFITAKEIARRGGEVHLVCRNEKRAEAARDEITKETGSQKVHYHILDLSQIKDVKNFTANFINEHKQLDVLINNAGEMIPNFTKTENEGFELTFATLVAGPFVLTSGLIPLLKKSSNQPRVINIGSAGMQLQRLNFDFFDMKPENYDVTAAYAQCKRQLAVLTKIWATEHSEINFSCMHPGWVDTPAARRGLGEFFEKMKDKFRTPEEGADTIIWLAISKASLSHANGSYFQDRERVKQHLPFVRTQERKNENSEFFQYMLKITRPYLLS